MTYGYIYSLFEENLVKESRFVFSCVFMFDDRVPVKELEELWDGVDWVDVVGCVLEAGWRFSVEPCWEVLCPLAEELWVVAEALCVDWVAWVDWVWVDLVVLVAGCNWIDDVLCPPDDDPELVDAVVDVVLVVTGLLLWLLVVLVVLVVVVCPLLIGFFWVICPL